MIKRVYNELNCGNWTEAEPFAYEAELKRIRDNQAVEDYVRFKALEEGEAKGIAKAKKENAAKMLQLGLDHQAIASVTGLSLEEVASLQTSIG
jgi:predicted transposase/invertase (TIGR01784 family)